MKKLVLNETISVVLVLGIILLIYLLMDIPQLKSPEKYTEIAAGIVIVIAFAVLFVVARISLKFAIAPGNRAIAAAAGDADAIGILWSSNIFVAFLASMVAEGSLGGGLVCVLFGALSAIGMFGLKVLAATIGVLLIAVVTTFAFTAIKGERFFYPYCPKKEPFSLVDSPLGILTVLITSLINFGILYGFPKILSDFLTK